MCAGFIFEQLFDKTSSTLTYIVGDAATCEAVIIDSVDHQMERDLEVLASRGLRLIYTLETHAHADHITAAGELRRRTGAKAAAPFNCGIDPADIHVEEGSVIRVGNEMLTAMETPGHTAGSVCYRWRDAVFTGDTLFIGGCGRTDFQGGDAGALYDSIVQRLFSLPDGTRVFPGHDYHGNRVSTIGEERRNNPRVSGKTREEFIAVMAALNLPKPKLIDVAVPANRRLGLPQG
jgi:glyoxylase-like metal-dependent hydrolase (beta-lactamase superfamily II)